MRVLLIVVVALLLAACGREAAPARDAGPATATARPAYVPPPAAEEPDAATAEAEEEATYPGGTDPGGQGWPPAMASGPDADCTGVLTAQFSGKGGRLRRGMAALGSRVTKDEFMPVLYFDNEGSAKRCKGGNESMVVAVWTGTGWRL